MSKIWDITTYDYFMKHGNDFPSQLVRRATRQLSGRGMESMEKLCAATPEQISKVRNIGGKSLEVALSIREKYASENGF